MLSCQGQILDQRKQEARSSIDRIHRGTKLTAEMVSHSRAALQESEKLVQDAPPIPFPSADLRAATLTKASPPA